MERLLKEIASIIGGTLRLTAVAYDGKPIHRGKFSRFERRVTHVHTSRRHDPDNMIVIRFNKIVLSEFNLKQRDRVYFDPSARVWFAIMGDGKEIIFSPELVGALYLTDREYLERLNFVIAGKDVRRVLFRVLYDNRKDMLREPLTLAYAVDKKGVALDTYAKEMMGEHADWFTPEERDLINAYLGTR